MIVIADLQEDPRKITDNLKWPAPFHKTKRKDDQKNADGKEDDFHSGSPEKNTLRLQWCGYCGWPPAPPISMLLLRLWETKGKKKTLLLAKAAFANEATLKLGGVEDGKNRKTKK